MNIFDSFVTWLEKVFKPLIDLYHEDSTTFFVGAILVVLVILIIIIVLARRAEGDEDKPSKKIKYEDIDWSTDDSRTSKSDAASEKPAAAPKPADAYEAALSKAYGVGDVDIEKNTFGHEGLSPEVTEALMRSVRAKREEDFSVPMWMTKQTLSLDDIELSDAQEWVEQQLMEKELQARDRKVERATVERIADILEKIDLFDKADENYKKKQTEQAETAEDTGGKIDLDKIAPLSEPEKETKPEIVPETPEDEKAPFETGTLEKIMKEAEEIKAEGNAGEDEADEEPDWGIAATLARLEAMQTENDSLLKEIEEDAALPGDYGEKKTEPDIDLYDLSTEPVPAMEKVNTGSEDAPAENEAAYRLEPQIRLSKKGTVRRFGLNNRDTNRSGRKFTEEELMKQIRD